jgi:hypothetical protein
MSRLTGGIFSKPSGQTAGVVFGQARTRQGKVVTARQLVVPTNPNTAGQQAQRGIFSYAKDIVRATTSGWYESAFNRAVSQLPGFQSMMSIMMRTIDSAGVVTAPSQTNLGSLDVLNVTSIVADASDGHVAIEFTNATPLKGSAGDLVYAVVIPKTAAKRAIQGNALTQLGVSTRDDTPIEITVPSIVAGDHFIVGIFVKGIAPNAGVFSPCVWTDVTAQA